MKPRTYFCCSVLVVVGAGCSGSNSSIPPARLTLRHGQSIPIHCLAYSPDGKILASGAVPIKLWDTATGKEINTLRAHKDDVRSIAFSPDGKKLVSGGEDGAVHVWNLRSPSSPHLSAGFVHHVYAVAFSPDGQSIAVGGSRLFAPNLALLNAQTCKLTTELKMSKGRSSLKAFADVESLAFSPDGKTLAVGCEDGAIRIWNLNTNIQTATLEVGGDLNEITSLAFAPDGKILVGACQDHTGDGNRLLRLWDAASFKEVGTIKLDNRAESVAFSPDGETLAVACPQRSGHDSDTDETIQFFNVRSASKSGSIRYSVTGRLKVAFNPSGKSVATASGPYGDNTIRIFDYPLQAK